jgi:hypothetical protein
MIDHSEAAKFVAHRKNQHDAVWKTMRESSERIEEYIDCVTYSVDWIIAESEILNGCVRYFDQYYRHAPADWDVDNDKARACYLLDQAETIITDIEKFSEAKVNKPSVALSAFREAIKPREEDYNE